MSDVWQLIYRPGPDLPLRSVTKTLDQWLVPNGEESLLVWMMRTAEERGLDFELLRRPS